jgi:hypothetical protein
MVSSNLGGLAGADKICQDRARAAYLPGTYMAWLSDSTGSPSTRFTRATAPYTLLDGTVVAGGWAGLTSGSLQHAITMTEFGGTVNVWPVWTNTLVTGVQDLSHTSCTNWSTDIYPALASVGSVQQASNAWTDDYAMYCASGPAKLYCFQQR